MILLLRPLILLFFLFNDTATTEIYTLSLHDALPISRFGGMKTYNWEGVNPDGYFLDKLEPIPSALPSFQKLFQVSATGTEEDSKRTKQAKNLGSASKAISAPTETT